jgi:cytochrome c biogenesis protein CcdA
MRIGSSLLFVLAGVIMFFALGNLFITVARSNYNYQNELFTALGGMIIADLCCAVVFFRGGYLRWGALVFALPSVFIVWEVLRRTPDVW